MGEASWRGHHVESWEGLVGGDSQRGRRWSCGRG